MKSDVEVRQDILAIVNASAIKTSIGGSVRIIPRAARSASEDCIISVVASQNGQIQDCTVNVNVYVPNINNGGDSVEDVGRTSQLAKICEGALLSGFGDGFRYWLDSQRILEVSGKDEHVINNVIRYKQLNE